MESAVRNSVAFIFSGLAAEAAIGRFYRALRAVA
jgi:hypothetical protein